MSSVWSITRVEPRDEPDAGQQRGDGERGDGHSDQEQRARLEHERLFEIFPDLLAVLSPDGILQRVNGAWERILGWQPRELVGHRSAWIIHPDDLPSLHDARTGLIANGRFDHEFRLRCRSGSYRCFKWTALDVPSEQGFYLLGRDVTDDRRRETELIESGQRYQALEAQLRQSQRLEAVGSLAGGIAHDFNNLLSVILSYSTMLVNDHAPGTRVHDDLVQIQAAGERAAALTRQLLAFSRRQILRPRVVDLNEVVEGLTTMLHRLIGETIDFGVFPCPTAAMVNVDPAQMEQVIVNLAVNARDAMPRGGKLSIEVQHATLDATYQSAHTEVQPGAYVMLAVSDTGIGMDPATQARIFEPFFTTKEVGKGTGLGLSTVFGIVRQSGGHVWVYSEPGRGSSFKIYLPSAFAEPESAALPPDPPVELRGSETVLLVEDEEQVRNLARNILARAGYTVIEAANGAEALQRADRPSIHLLLTDMVMPRMGGAHLASRLAAERPELRVVYMSGYTDTSATEHGLPQGAAFVQKPFTPEALLRKVRSALAAPPMPQPEPRTILRRVMLIDDQVVMLRLLARALSRYELVQFTDPREALSRLREGERFDAIVCDVYMPGMTGPEFQSELSKLAEDQAQRMLFLTGASLGQEMGGFVELNAGRILHKPVDLLALRHSVEEVVGG
ncbi:MAG TPA: response regulator [Myxococcales bacterium]|jgi:PAS domain S-box-containing protein